MYAGGGVVYCTKFKGTVAYSSTESEFTVACDTRKLILYFRSLLEDMKILQPDTNILYEVNNGALMMAETQK